MDQPATEQVKQEVPELDYECSTCGGEGEITPDYNPRFRSTCHTCDGMGRIPTDFGEKVLAFVLGRIKVSARIE